MESETPYTSELGLSWEVIPRNYSSSPQEATEAAQQALQTLQTNSNLIDILSFLSILLSPRNPLISKGENEVVIQERNGNVYSIKATTLYTYFVPNTLTLGIVGPDNLLGRVDLHNVKTITFVACRDS